MFLASLSMLYMAKFWKIICHSVTLILIFGFLAIYFETASRTHDIATQNRKSLVQTTPIRKNNIEMFLFSRTLSKGEKKEKWSSVSKFGEISPIWQNYKYIWQSFDG